MEMESLKLILGGLGMPALQIVAVLAIFYALRQQIMGLKSTVEAQKETLEVMERRTVETEKIASLYQNLLKELPESIEKYKNIVEKTTGEVIESLERNNSQQTESIERHKQEKEQLVSIKQQLTELVEESFSTSKSLSKAQERTIEAYKKMLQLQIVSIEQLKQRTVAHIEHFFTAASDATIARSDELAKEIDLIFEEYLEDARSRSASDEEQK